MKYSPTTGGFYRPGHTPSKIPADAVDVQAEDYPALMAAIARGCTIQADPAGYPVAVEPSAPSADEVIKAQIVELEASITPRRMREALLGTDGGWLAGVDAQIAALRGQLTV